MEEALEQGDPAAFERAQRQFAVGVGLTAAAIAMPIAAPIAAPGGLGAVALAGAVAGGVAGALTGGLTSYSFGEDARDIALSAAVGGGIGFAAGAALGATGYGAFVGARRTIGAAGWGLRRAIPNRGWITGRRTYLAKLARARAGDLSARAEIRAANALRREGFNVHFRTEINDYRILQWINQRVGGRLPLSTPDFLVWRVRGGLFARMVDVYQPTTAPSQRIISVIAGKTSHPLPFFRQASSIYLDLSRSSVTAAELGGTGGNIRYRVWGYQRSWRNWGRLKDLWIVE